MPQLVTADIVKMTPFDTFVSGTNETLRAANAYTDAHSGGGGGCVNTNAVIDIANRAVETNATVVATITRVTSLETATDNLMSSVSNLSSSVSGLQSSKADISMISATDTTFSNAVATVARTVTPQPSQTLRIYDSVRQCWWVLEMVNGVPTWTVED